MVCTINNIPPPLTPASLLLLLPTRRSLHEGRAALHEEATGGSQHVLPIPRGRRPRAAGIRARRNHRATDWIAGGVAGVHDGSVQEARCGGGGRGRGTGEPQGDKHVHRGRTSHTGGRQVVGEYLKRTCYRRRGWARILSALVVVQFW